MLSNRISLQFCGARSREVDWLLLVYLSSLPVAHLSDAPRRRLVQGIQKINNSWTELFNFQNSFNCHHNNCHILRWREWELLVFCKQTPV